MNAIVATGRGKGKEHTIPNVYTANPIPFLSPLTSKPQAKEMREKENPIPPGTMSIIA